MKMSVMVLSCLLPLLVSCVEPANPVEAQSKTDPQRLAGTATGDERALEIVQRSIEHTGGWENWKKTSSVRFRKTTIRYGDDGQEIRPVQTHLYQLHTGPRMRIEWEDQGMEYVLLNSGTRAWKFADGVELTSTEENNSARNSTFGSHYVFNMPFKLLDPGVVLHYAGEETLDDGSRVEKVRAEYPPGVGDAGGYHEWTYYFDVATGRHVANLLEYGPDQYDFTEYIDERQVGPFRLPMRRYGYPADESGKAGPRASEIIYENIELDVPVADDLFDPESVRR